MLLYSSMLPSLLFYTLLLLDVVVVSDLNKIFRWIDGFGEKKA